MSRAERMMMGRRVALGGALAVAGCAAAPQDTVPRLSADRTGYIAFQAPIGTRLRDSFVGTVERLLAQNPATIYVLMSSPGGEVEVAQEMISFLERIQRDRGVAVVTHNAGVVASAACYVFLAGRRRLSVPRGAFLFHEAALVSNGPITSRRLQEESVKVQAIERSFLDMLRARTRLTEGEASSFVRRTVILNAEEARRDGITDGTAEFSLPAGATIFSIRATVRPAPEAARPPLPG